MSVTVDYFLVTLIFLEFMQIRKVLINNIKNYTEAEFSFEQGITAICGPNGAGKTTTIKMMCGLVTPSAGNVYLNGFHVINQRRQAMQQIGVVL
ncbi:MAG: AAA family ATPase, partial [Blastocatellia bacterium]|nr:AAA family ATPase [Blastocatellia bacterium]